MSTDATTLRPREKLLDGRAGLGLTGESARRLHDSAGGEPRLQAGAHPRRDKAIGASALIWIGACVLLIVLAAADRPSFLSSPSHYGFFPRWLAGPLGGLWPGFTRSPPAIKALLTGALVTMYAAYLIGLKYVPRLRARWTIATLVAVHALLLLSPPLSLTDVFNYINYGRMGMVHGLDPYTTIPALGPHGDLSYALSNWHQLLTPYGPLFTLITYAVVPLGIAGSLWAFKGMLMVLSLATLWLVWRCARLLGRDGRDSIRAIALVGLNPLILVWGVGGDHNDFFMVFCVTLAFYLLLRARAPGIAPELEPIASADSVESAGCPESVASPEPTASPRSVEAVSRGSAPSPAAAWHSNGQPPGAIPPSRAMTRTDPLAALAAGIEGGGDEPDAERRLWRRRLAWLWPPAPPEVGAGVALAAAIALKASAAILVPVVLVALLRAPRRLAQVAVGLAAGGIVLGVAAVAVFGFHIPDLGVQGRLVIPMGLPNLFGLALGQGGETETMRSVLSVVLIVSVAGCCVLAWRRHDALSAAGWATIALMVTLSWVLPWYVLWVLPLAALSRSRRLRASALAFGAFLLLTWMPLATAMDNALGIRPTTTTLGRQHQRSVRELLN